MLRQGASVYRARGRPQRLPVDPSPATSRTIDAQRRTAWLLATCRSLPPTGAVPRKQFCADLRRLGILADGSRVSRWESGAHPVGPEVIGAYEALTDTLPGSLMSAYRLLRRMDRPPATIESPAELGTDECDAIFERIEARTATGQDWLRLAADLSHYDRVYLHPRTWREVGDRLVCELTRSAGPALVLRYEAAASLMSHPESRRHLARSVGRFVMHPDAQNVAPALWLLREVGDEATDLVLRLIGSPKPVLRQAAGSVAALLATRGDLAHRDPDLLERYVVTELRRRGSLARSVDAVDLATQLPNETFDRIIDKVDNRHVRRHVLRARESLELTDDNTARIIAEGIGSYAEAHVRRGAPEPDRMLRVLVREALFHAHKERRELAGVLLACSPYGEYVKQAVLGLTDEPEPLVSGQAWSMLRRMGHLAPRTELADKALGAPAETTRAQALVTLGVGHGPVDDAHVTELLRLAGSRGFRTRHGALFALGMEHHHLDRFVAEEGERGRAARWWRSVGPALHEEHPTQRRSA